MFQRCWRNFRTAVFDYVDDLCETFDEKTVTDENSKNRINFKRLVRTKMALGPLIERKKVLDNASKSKSKSRHLIGTSFSDAAFSEIIFGNRHALDLRKKKKLGPLPSLPSVQSLSTVSICALPMENSIENVVRENIHSVSASLSVPDLRLLEKEAPPPQELELDTQSIFLDDQQRRLQKRQQLRLERDILMQQRIAGLRRSSSSYGYHVQSKLQEKLDSEHRRRNRKLLQSQYVLKQSLHHRKMLYRKRAQAIRSVLLFSDPDTVDPSAYTIPNQEFIDIRTEPSPEDNNKRQNYHYKFESSPSRSKVKIKSKTYSRAGQRARRIANNSTNKLCTNVYFRGPAMGLRPLQRKGKDNVRKPPKLKVLLPGLRSETNTNTNKKPFQYIPSPEKKTREKKINSKWVNKRSKGVVAVNKRGKGVVAVNKRGKGVVAVNVSTSPETTSKPLFNVPLGRHRNQKFKGNLNQWSPPQTSKLCGVRIGTK